MKYFLTIIVISLFLQSCKEREITVLKKEVIQLSQKCDSLDNLLYITRAFLHDTDSLSPFKYYITGSESDLMILGIITRASGISREYKLSNYLSKQHFICKHKEQIDTIRIEGKEIRIIGSFNPDYYTLTESKDGTIHNLIIRNKDHFWENNVLLVITHK